MSGCSREKAQVSFEFSTNGNPHLGPEEFSVEFSDGVGSRVLTGPELFTVDDRRVFETRRSGTLRIHFEARVGQVTASEGDLELPLRSDWRWGVTFFPDSADPTRYCFGCMGYKGFALDSAYRVSPADSFYSIWSGNSIRNPVVY